MYRAQSPAAFRRCRSALAAALLLSAGVTAAADKDADADKSKTAAVKPAVVSVKAPASVSAAAAQSGANATLKNDGKTSGEIRDGSSQTTIIGETPVSALPALPGIDRGTDKTNGASGTKIDAGAADRLGTLPSLRDGSSTTTLLQESATQGDKPAFDQGFGAQTTVDTKAGAAASTGRSGNPVSALTGSTIGGPLGAAASAGKTPGGIAGQGKGAVSESDNAYCANHPDDCNGDGPMVTTHESKDGRNYTEHYKGETDVWVNGQYVGTKRDDGSVYEKDKPPPYPKNSAGAPVRGDEGRSTLSKQQYLDQKLNDRHFQIVQGARQNGSTDPGRGDDATTVGHVAGTAAPSQSTTGRNLFGQPGRGETRGGGGSSGGPDFNGHSGAVDPGDEQTVTAGNRQQDPGAALGTKPGPSFPSSTDASQNDSSANTDDRSKGK